MSTNIFTSYVDECLKVEPDADDHKKLIRHIVQMERLLYKGHVHYCYCDEVNKAIKDLAVKHSVYSESESYIFSTQYLLLRVLMSDWDTDFVLYNNKNNNSSYIKELASKWTSNASRAWNMCDDKRLGAKYHRMLEKVDSEFSKYIYLTSLCK